MKRLVSSECLRECGLLASFQNIERVSAQGHAAALSDVCKMRAMKISAIMKEACEQEEKVSPKWEERFPGLLLESKEIEAHHASAYPASGASSVGALVVGKFDCWWIQIPSLVKIRHSSFLPSRGEIELGDDLIARG